MRYPMVGVVLLAGIATTVGLGGITAAFPMVHLLIVVAFLATLAMAMNAKPRPT